MTDPGNRKSFEQNRTAGRPYCGRGRVDIVDREGALRSDKRPIPELPPLL